MRNNHAYKHRLPACLGYDSTGRRPPLQHYPLRSAFIHTTFYRPLQHYPLHSVFIHTTALRLSALSPSLSIHSHNRSTPFSIIPFAQYSFTQRSTPFSIIPFAQFSTSTLSSMYHTTISIQIELRLIYWWRFKFIYREFGNISICKKSIIPSYLFLMKITSVGKFTY